MNRIGKYEIRRVLGEAGATSLVYLGYDPFAQREVAIKQLHRRCCWVDHTTLYHHLLLNGPPRRQTQHPTSSRSTTR